MASKGGDDDDNKPTICPYCSKVVYFAERILGHDGLTWHRACLIKHNQSTARMPGAFESDPLKKGKLDVNPSYQDLSTEIKEKRASTYDKDLERRLIQWIEAVTGEKLSSNDFQAALKDGVILCKLVNKIKPGIVPGVRKPSKIAYICMESIDLFLKACTQLGLNTLDLFMSADLWDGSNMNAVLDCLKALGRVARNVPSFSGPHLEGVKPPPAREDATGDHPSVSHGGTYVSHAHNVASDVGDEDGVSITVDIED
eukprot:TRINITY_DN1479_c0_g1_i1.p1 TRINITY_DN1479_c0_g1~~TRINITY_DN1479_c0_g1_i1.p1  ORF type:complete len:280 (-),score=63.46 TRINITY_DN1479_c0_g1_i1:106-873(-)